MRVPVGMKLVPNPDYRKSDAFFQKCLLSGYPMEDFLPGEYDKALPEDGAWIILLKSVHVGMQKLDGTVKSVDVPHLSMWFAIPHITTSGRAQAIVQTLDGPVHVWAHEYNVVSDIGRLLESDDCDGIETHFISESANFNEYAMFYLRSRGISKKDAQRMLLASLKDPHYCYFTFTPYVTERFSEGAGMSYFMPHNHKRREESRKKKESKCRK